MLRLDRPESKCALKAIPTAQSRTETGLLPQCVGKIFRAFELEPGGGGSDF